MQWSILTEKNTNELAIGKIIPSLHITTFLENFGGLYFGIKALDHWQEGQRGNTHLRKILHIRQNEYSQWSIITTFKALPNAWSVSMIISGVCSPAEEHLKTLNELEFIYIYPLFSNMKRTRKYKHIYTQPKEKYLAH